MSISQTICDFATLAIEAGGWMEMDRLYLQNRLLGMVGEDALESIEVRPVKEESVDLLDQLVAKAREMVFFQNCQQNKRFLKRN